MKKQKKRACEVRMYKVHTESMFCWPITNDRHVFDQGEYAVLIYIMYITYCGKQWDGEQVFAILSCAAMRVVR
jgi:hypothetical protein